MKKEFMLAAPDVVRQFLIYNEAIKNKASSSIDVTVSGNIRCSERYRFAFLREITPGEVTT